ncbi:MAG TPA: hypothetical protein VGH51_09495 [Candidatus Angelobacter sp.]|jgi:hypothetical protein
MIPFACDMTALTPQQRQRHHGLGKVLRASLLGMQELADGYEFEFAADGTSYAALAELTQLEHACCPFFDISIRLEGEGGKLWWRLTGMEGVKPFIRAEFESWFGDRAL